MLHGTICEVKGGVSKAAKLPIIKRKNAAHKRLYTANRNSLLFKPHIDDFEAVNSPSSLLPAATKQPPHHTPSALTGVHHTTPHRRAALGNGVYDRARRPADITPVLVFTLALGAVDAFLGEGIADGREKTVLADLAGDEAVHAVLEGVDLFDACYFGLVEGVYCRRGKDGM